MTEERKTVARDLPNVEHEDFIQPSREELMIVLRSLERQGLTASCLGSDGQVRWCLTEKGKHTKPSDADDYFYPVS